MYTPRIYTSYADLGDAALATVAGKTLTDMTANANFADPVPTLEDYGAVVNDYRAKHEAAAETGGRFATTAKDIARLALLRQMKRLASYVNFTAEGDAHKLVSSGFTLIPPPESHTVPGVPLWVRMRRGPQKGQLMFDVAKVKFVWQYEYQIGTRTEGSESITWDETIYSTTRSRGNVIAGLESVKTYWVRVRGMNGLGVGDWSEAVSGSTE
ncbi:hypothetical protein [Parapedobacter sp. 2B3]|uniref:hypothetical protein n=1 Tax=Parapedobacter sp. 2B3 TaxID=3342381 RepID=UPI0035B5AD7E